MTALLYLAMLGVFCRAAVTNRRRAWELFAVAWLVVLWVTIRELAKRG